MTTSAESINFGLWIHKSMVENHLKQNIALKWNYSTELSSTDTVQWNRFTWEGRNLILSKPFRWFSIFRHFELHVFDIMLAIVWSIVLWFETTKCHCKYLLQKPVRRVSQKYVFSLAWYLKVVGIKVHGHCHCKCEISEIGKHYSSPVSLQNHFCI